MNRNISWARVGIHFILLSILLSIYYGCDQRKFNEGDIQREEALDKEDIRENDSYNKQIPLDDKGEELPDDDFVEEE